MYIFPKYADAFRTAAKNPNREIDTRVVVDFAGVNAELTTSDISTYKITKSSVAGKSFTPGSFVAGQLEISLVASSPEVEKLNFKNTSPTKLEVKAGIQLPEGLAGMAYVPMGVFYPEEDGVTFGGDGYITIQALDIPPILQEQFTSDSLPLPCTVETALFTISTQTGISVVFASNFANLDVEISETFSLTTTYREAIMYLAEIVGAYASMGRQGEIKLAPMSGEIIPEAVFSPDENYLYSVDIQNSTVKPYQYIGIKANKDDLGVTQEVAGVTTGCRYDIIDNPLTYGHPEDFLEGLVNPLSFEEFYPAKVSFHGRPDIDLSDVLFYAYQGIQYALPVCSHVFEYNGGFKTTIEGIGSDTLNTSSVDAGVKASISALRQSINTLVRDLSSTKSQIVDINGDVEKISTLLQTVSKIQSQISDLEDGVGQISTLTQTAGGLKFEIESLGENLQDTNDTVNKNQATLLSYFDFQADGLIIGLSSSNIKLKLSNDRIQFLKDDSTEVAYFSEGQLYVTDAHFLRSLVLGNFEFVPRSNGNLSLRYRG